MIMTIKDNFDILNKLICKDVKKFVIKITKKSQRSNKLTILKIISSLNNVNKKIN